MADDSGDTEPYFADFTKTAAGKRTPVNGMASRAVDLVHWKDPKESAVVFVTTLAAIYMLAWSNRTVVSLSCALLAVHLIASVATSLLHGSKAAKPAPMKIDPEAAKAVVDSAVTFINGKLAWYSDVLSGRNLAAFQILGVLVAGFFVGGWFSGAMLIFLAFIGAFSLPVLYVKNQKVVDDKVSLLKDKLDELIEKVSSKIPKAGEPSAPPLPDKKAD
mmetsp:Transcript_66600/g.157926  ORF Transcript_66600/g.157926 Transcript_66600/m.157926 type:complete len:218 (+) Transcript_66600:23-676(+)